MTTTPTPPVRSLPPPERLLGAFRIMGRTILTDFAFRDLPPIAVDAPATSVLARAGSFPDPGVLVRQIAGGDDAEAGIRVYEGMHGIHYQARGIGEFLIEPSGERVWYRACAGAAHGDVEHMLSGPVLGLAFQLQGQVLLHAGAVVVDGAAVAFAAPHGAGKSTLAASFVRAGHPMLTDDVLPLTTADEGVIAHHSLPRIKLWEDSLAALGESRERYDIVLSGYEKRRVRVGRDWGEAAAGGAPLAGLYLLAPHLDGGRGIEIAALEPVPAALQLVANMYMADMLHGQRAAHALHAAAQIVSAVRVRRLSYCRRYEGLAALRAAIIADLRRGEDLP